jgi:beta-mannosidase
MLSRFVFCFLLCFFLSSLIAQTAERKLDNEKWKFRQIGTSRWYPANVPGTVHTDLFSNRLIPDPFEKSNEKSLQWIERTDWEYKANFKISESELRETHLEIEFEGLDTYAEVFLNDSCILVADNMFRSWKTDIKKVAKKGKNELRIRFKNVITEAESKAKQLSYKLPGDEKVFTRKAQYQYGWDWGPRYITAGIWKSIRLLSWSDARILNIQCVQRELTDSLASLDFVCEIQSDIENSAYIDITFSHTKDLSGQRTRKIKLIKGINSYTISYSIRQPQLWWTNELGFPVMYSFALDLSYDSHILNSKTLNVGLRKLELVQARDSAGSSFYFKLNGIPLFIKGANYIPQDNFLPRIKPQDYENVVVRAKESHMNMLRVWGGGVYGSDDLYNSCDRNGILVWQDFMFACAMYPGDVHFVQNVAEEIEGQVRRLRNHPSLALWCGNNEIDEGWKNWGWQKQYAYSTVDSITIAREYELLFNNLIPDMLKVHDPERAYWSSSPSTGWGHQESMRSGDSHYWGVWWGMEPFEVYKQKTGRFVSEYGFQSMPAISTFKTIGLDPEKFLLDSTILQAHQKHPAGYQTIRTYMERDYKVPSKFEDYIYVSQLLQARGMKTAIEAHRRKKPYCMGTLYWQFNDCWPVTSWSSTDYYGNWKASQYEVKRDYKDIIISVDEQKDSCEVYIISDRLKNEKAELSLQLIDFDGNLLWYKSIPVMIEANTSRIYFKIGKNLPGYFGLNHVFLKSSLKGMEDHATDIINVHYFVRPKDLELKKTQVIIGRPVCEKVQCISLTSDVLIKDVFITIKGEPVTLSDNFFDLLPGESKIVYLPAGSHIKKLNKKILIKSLIDAY